MTTPIELLIQGRDETGGAFASAQSGLSKIAQIATGILSAQIFQKLATGVMDFTKSIISEAREAALIQADLNAVLTSTGGVAGITADMVNELADKYQYLSKYTDEEIIRGETLMLQFTNLSKDIFPAATQAALDLASRTGQDVTQAFNLVGRALERPEEGIGKLNMAFKLFSEEELKAVQAMAESGDLAGAQAAILDRLAEKVGGAAAAQVQPWENVKKKMDNMKELLGTALLPLMDKLGTTLTSALDNPKVQKAIEQIVGWLGANGPAAVDKLIAGISELSGIFQGLMGDAQNLINNGLGFISQWWDKNGGGIMIEAEQIFGGLKDLFAEVSADVGPLISQVFDKLSAWFNENGPLIQEVIRKIADNFTTYFLPAILVVWETVQPILMGFLDLILGVVKTIMQIFTGDWAGAWETAKNTVVNVFESLIQAAMNLISGILAIFGTSVPEIAANVQAGFENMRGVIANTFENMKLTVVTKFTEIKTGIETKITSIITSLTSKISAFTKLGADIVKKIQDGISGAWSSFVGWITAQVNEIVNQIIAAITGGGGAGTGGGNGTSVGTSIRPGGSGKTGGGSSISNVTNSPLYNFGVINQTGDGGIDILSAFG